MNFSRYTSGTPKACCASLRAVSHAGTSSSRLRTTRMPRPPPPAEALMISGKPMRPASDAAASGSPTMPLLPGTIGYAGGGHLPAGAVPFRPSAAASRGEGPMKVMCEASQTSAKLAFSERNP